MALWRNNKKGTLYHVVSFNARNCTNAQDGQVCVAYRSTAVPDAELYFREKEEFYTKFTEMVDFTSQPGGLPLSSGSDRANRV